MEAFSHGFVDPPETDRNECDKQECDKKRHERVGFAVALSQIPRHLFRASPK